MRVSGNVVLLVLIVGSLAVAGLAIWTHQTGTGVALVGATFYLVWKLWNERDREE